MRAQVDPFAYDRGGAVLVGVDLNEMTAYAGTDEGRLWTSESTAQIVALGVAGGEIVSVDGAGVVERRSAATGEIRGRVALSPARAARANPRALAVSASGACAVALAERVAIVDEGEPRYFTAHDVNDIDFREDGMALALGFETGEVRVVDLMGHVVAATRFDDAIDGLCWSPRGAWLVSSGGDLHTWDGVRQDVLLALAGAEPLRSPTCSASGAMVAFRLGVSVVRVYATESGRSIGEIEYLDRPVGTVQFGPALWLAIGLDRGDGNRVDLATSALHRAEAPSDVEGRLWSVQVRVRTEVAIAAEGGREAAPTLDAAGGPAPSPKASRRPSGAHIKQRDQGLTICCGCGDPKDTVVCPQCGAVNGTFEDRAAEREALADLHEVLARAGSAERLEILRKGWVPEDRRVLLEAARLTEPLLGEPGQPLDELGEAAAARLDRIIDRLKRARQDPETFKTILRLEQRLREAREPPRRRWPVVVVALLGLLVLAVIAALLLTSCAPGERGLRGPRDVVVYNGLVLTNLDHGGELV